MLEPSSHVIDVGSIRFVYNIVYYTFYRRLRYTAFKLISIDKNTRARVSILGEQQIK